jgi:V/A-type H+-transporting ATPase subunit K
MKKQRLLIIFLIPLALIIPLASVAAALTVSPPLPQAQATSAGAYDRLGIAIGAGLAVGLSALAAGLAISATGTAAISALTEKPDTFFRSFLIVALSEALAIYGLIVGILLWLKL